MQSCEMIGGRRGPSLAAYRDTLITINLWLDRLGATAPNPTTTQGNTRTEQAMPAGGVCRKPLTRRLAQGAAWSASPERARATDQRC